MMTKRETIAEMLERGAEIQTESGHDVRILMTDGGGPFPVVGAYYTPQEGVWTSHHWREYGETDWFLMSLIEKPQIRVYERWVNVYEDFAETFMSRKAADLDTTRADSRIACIHIRQEYTVGEGLEEETANQEETDNE